MYPVPPGPLAQALVERDSHGGHRHAPGTEDDAADMIVRRLPSRNLPLLGRAPRSLRRLLGDGIDERRSLSSRGFLW